MLSNKIYSYDPWNHNWTLLTASFSARYLHTANFISSGMMIVFGGNTHNDTSHSFGAKCYSNDLLMYDVLCDTWYQGSMPKDLQADLARYGHSAQVFENKLWIYGGFDGQMLSDVITFTPGNCKYYEKQELCLSANSSNSLGVKCVWDMRESSCKSLDEIQNHPNFKIHDKGEESFIRCTKKGRIEMTQLHIAKEMLCYDQHSCRACLSTSSECGYCENTALRRGSCVLEKCSELVITKSKTSPSVSLLKTVDKCPNENDSSNDPLCSPFSNCHACTAIPECLWSVDVSKCVYHGNRTTDDTNICPPACATLKNCGNCTQEDCIWCQNEERCVDKNAYIASFPVSTHFALHLVQLFI
jgi:attractin